MQNATFPISALCLRIAIPIEASFFVLIDIILFIGLCFRFKTKPVQAHGRLFLLSKLTGSCILFLRYVIVYAIEGEEVHSASIWQQIRAFLNVLLIVVVPPIYSVPFFLQFWRIFHTFEYNRLKALITSEEAATQYQTRLKFHRFSTSIWFTLLLILVNALVYSIVFIIGTVLAFTTSMDTTTYFVIGFGGTMATIINIAMVIVIIATLIRQSKAPYNIYLTAIVSVIVTGIFAVFQIGAAFKNRLPTDISYLLFNILITALPLYLMMIDVVITVGVPIIQSFIYKSGKMKVNEEKSEEVLQLEAALANREVQNLFQKFCTQEWSSENFLFFKQFLLWQSIQTEEEKLVQARVLYSIFLDKQSHLQLNTTSSKIELVQQGLQKGDSQLIEKSLKQIFDDCKVAMSDTFSRFCFYDPYVKYKRRSSAKLDASKQVGWQ